MMVLQWMTYILAKSDNGDNLRYIWEIEIINTYEKCFANESYDLCILMFKQTIVCWNKGVSQVTYWVLTITRY